MLLHQDLKLKTFIHAQGTIQNARDWKEHDARRNGGTLNPNNPKCKNKEPHRDKYVHEVVDFWRENHTSPLSKRTTVIRFHLAVPSAYPIDALHTIVMGKNDPQNFPILNNIYYKMEKANN